MNLGNNQLTPENERKFGIGKRFKSVNWGDFEITGYVEDDTDRRMIKFVETGYERECHMTTISSGNVSDKSIKGPGIYGIGTVHETKLADSVTVIALVKNNKNRRKVEFSSDGSIRTYDLASIRDGGMVSPKLKAKNLKKRMAVKFVNKLPRNKKGMINIAKLPFNYRNAYNKIKKQADEPFDRLDFDSALTLSKLKEYL